MAFLTLQTLHIYTCMCVQLLGQLWLFVACQASLSMGYPRQEYWSGLPFPSQRDLLNPGIEPASPTLAGSFFTTEPPGKSSHMHSILINLYIMDEAISPMFYGWQNWSPKRLRTELSVWWWVDVRAGARTLQLHLSYSFDPDYRAMW